MKMMHGLVLGSMGLALLVGSADAWADVVGPPPTTCPQGAEASTCHGGPHCRPRTCMTDADCQTDTVCKDRSYCTGKINCAGGLPPDADISMYDVTTVESTCTPGDTCDGGAVCSTLKVCVPKDSGSSSGSAGGGGGTQEDMGVVGGCSCGMVAARSGIGAIVLGIGALVGLALRGRRQRK